MRCECNKCAITMNNEDGRRLKPGLAAKWYINHSTARKPSLCAAFALALLITVWLRCNEQLQLHGSRIDADAFLSLWFTCALNEFELSFRVCFMASHFTLGTRTPYLSLYYWAYLSKWDVMKRVTIAVQNLVSRPESCFTSHAIRLGGLHKDSWSFWWSLADAAKVKQYRKEDKEDIKI